MRGRRQAFLLIAWHDPVPHACVPYRKLRAHTGAGGNWGYGGGEDLERLGWKRIWRG